MSLLPTDSDDRLGTEVGALVRRRVAATPLSSLRLDRIVAGADRRRSTRRRVRSASLGLIVTAGLGIGALAVAGHDPENPVEDVGSAPARLPLLPAHAIPAGVDDQHLPERISAESGGQAYGSVIPAIDVWRAGSETLVVRTFVPDEPADSMPSPKVTEVVPTTAAGPVGGSRPWGEAIVDELKIRGVTGGLQLLAVDQFAVWIPTADPTAYSVVIGRGMDRERVIELTESLVDADGILEPASGFEAVERAAALPSSTPTRAWSQVGSTINNGPWVSTSVLPVGRASLETATWFEVGRLDVVDGQEVMSTIRPGGWLSARWLDPSGAMVSWVGEADDARSAVAAVRMIGEARFVRIAGLVSSGLAAGLPEVERLAVGGFTLVRRQSDDGDALCLDGIDPVEHCVESWKTVGEDVQLTVLSTIDVGHWIIAGYRQRSAAEEQGMPDGLNLDDMHFTDPGGSCCEIEWIRSGEGYWWVVRIDDEIDSVSTNFGMVVGGMIGSISRPLDGVASPLT